MLTVELQRHKNSSNKKLLKISDNQGCKSIATSLSAISIALLSPPNIADTPTDTIAIVLSPLPIAIDCQKIF